MGFYCFMDNINEQSLNSSVEVYDEAINDSWSWAKLHKNNALKSQDFVRLNIGDLLPEDESIFGRVWRFWNERAITHRINEFEKREIKHFNAQRIAKIEQICSDEKAKHILIERMICPKNQELLHDSYEVLKRKYGVRMADCIIHRSKCNESFLRSRPQRISVSSLSVIDGLSGANPLAEVLATLQLIDPLATWFKQKSEISGRMLARIQNLASSASTKVKWSLLIEPGRPQTDLSSFYTEFDVLETFFDKVELSAEELSQRVFDANYTTKARNRKIECADCSRVKLVLPEELTRSGITAQELAIINHRRPQPSDIFGDCDCLHVNAHNDCGFGDFIHASYVLGGPLLNKFILTQAPLPQTIPDFWRMIWQEKCEYIFMLCESSDTESLGLMSSSVPDCCPYYWPRYEGETKQFGRLIIRNEGLDTTIDPLFNVTYLVMWVEDEPGVRLKVQHWQWDWRDYADFHWPFRLLIRSRHSKTPTVVHCMDGCGRSGALVLIEIFLMQLLRGTTSYENTMLTSAVFLRLQRRHAVANHIQYLFAYRAVLYWAEPYIVSKYHRLVLGFLFNNSGFAGKYDLIAHYYSKKK